MQFRRILGWAATAAFMTAAVCSGEPAKASVTGSGMFKTRGEDGLPKFRTFTFHAVTHQDGTTTGKAEIQNREQGVTTHINIDCLAVAEGKVARMSGTVERSTNAGWVGLPVWFKVVDNGEGGKAEADRITLVSFFEWGAVACTDPWFDDEVLWPIAAGNVQVK